MLWSMPAGPPHATPLMVAGGESWESTGEGQNGPVLGHQGVWEAGAESPPGEAGLYMN